MLVVEKMSFWVWVLQEGNMVLTQLEPLETQTTLSAGVVEVALPPLAKPNIPVTASVSAKSTAPKAYVFVPVTRRTRPTVEESAAPSTKLPEPSALIKALVRLVAASEENVAFWPETLAKVERPATFKVDWRVAALGTTNEDRVALPEVVNVPNEPRPVVWMVPEPAFKEETTKAPVVALPVIFKVPP